MKLGIRKWMKHLLQPAIGFPDDPSPDLDDHWVWTGYVQKPSSFVIARHLGPERPIRNYTVMTTATPKVTYQKRSTSPQRVLYAHVHNIPINEVPRLKRICTHALCVNPAHFSPGLPVPSPARPTV